MLQDWEWLGKQIDQNVSDDMVKWVHTESLVALFVLGFILMRIFKTTCFFLLSKKNKICKILGILVIFAVFFVAQAGVLASASHLSSTEFGSFHITTAALFFLELIVWETGATFCQMITCSIYIKATSAGTKRFFKMLCNPIVFQYLDTTS